MNAEETKGQVTITGVVIAIPTHESYLSRVLEDIETQETPLDELILIASGKFATAIINEISGRLTGLPIPSKLITSKHLQSAGRNRNIGIASATSEYVMFFDADDRYSSSRVAAAKKQASKGSYDLLLHHSLLDTSGLDYVEVAKETSSRHAGAEWHSRALFEATFPTGHRDRLSEIGGAETIIRCPEQCHPSLVLHHGHIVVRRDIVPRLARFHERSWPRNEDSLFDRDVLWNGGRVVVLEDPLSTYVTNTSSARKSSTPLKTTVRLIFLLAIAFRRFFALIAKRK